MLGKAVNIRKRKHTCIESLNTQRYGNQKLKPTRNLNQEAKFIQVNRKYDLSFKVLKNFTSLNF